METFVDPETRYNGTKKYSFFEKNQQELMAIIEKVNSKRYIHFTDKNLYTPALKAPLGKNKKK